MLGELVQRYRRRRVPVEEPTKILMRKLPDRVSDAYYICNAAESRLQTAVTQRAFVIVNDASNEPAFLVKMYGRTLAIALKQDPESGIEPGHWYILEDKSKRESLRTAFIDGKSHVTLPGSNTWLQGREAVFVWRQAGLDTLIKEAVTNFSDAELLRGADREARARYIARNNEELGARNPRLENS